MKATFDRLADALEVLFELHKIHVLLDVCEGKPEAETLARWDAAAADLLAASGWTQKEYDDEVDRCSQ